MALMNKLFCKPFIELDSFVIIWSRIFVNVLMRTNWFRKFPGNNLPKKAIGISSATTEFLPTDMITREKTYSSRAFSGRSAYESHDSSSRARKASS